MGKPEAQVEDHLVASLEAAGGLCYKFSAQLRKGVPDRLCSLPGVGVFFVETKAPGGRLSPRQIERHTQMRQAGCPVFLASARDEVDALISELTGPNGPARLAAELSAEHTAPATTRPAFQVVGMGRQ